MAELTIQLMPHASGHQLMALFGDIWGTLGELGLSWRTLVSRGAPLKTPSASCLPPGKELFSPHSPTAICSA